MMRIPRRPPADGHTPAPPDNLLTWQERLKYALIPRGLYAWLRDRRLMRRGEVELKLLPFLVDPTRGAIDVGANKGTYSYFLSRLCPRVNAYEPNPAMRSVLKRMVGGNVVISEKAASNASGPAVLAVPCLDERASNNIGTLCIDRLEGAYHPVAVEQVRLDDEPLTNIGFIKIDVEGFELEVVTGAEKLIRRDRPVLLVEIVEEHTGRPVVDTVRHIERIGYQTMVVSHGRLIDFRAYQSRPTKERIRNYIFLPNVAVEATRAAA
jgi:FkbM family methyltransferase